MYSLQTSTGGQAGLFGAELVNNEPLGCCVWWWICGERRPVAGQSPAACWAPPQRGIDHHIKRAAPTQTHNRHICLPRTRAVGWERCTRVPVHEHHWWSGDKGGVIDIAVSLWAATPPPLSAHSITLRRVWGVVKKKEKKKKWSRRNDEYSIH